MKAPIFIGELELTEPIASVSLPARDDGQAYTGALLLVRARHIPVGYVFCEAGGLDADAIVAQVWGKLAGQVNAQRARAGLAPLGALPLTGIPAEDTIAADAVQSPLVSIVVCTRDRPESLMVTLRGLADLRYQPVEIVVVDNAPSSDATKKAVLGEFGGDPRFRYVTEPRPGLSCARNRGLAEASADIVAFTDDDVKVDPWWIDGITRGFRAAPGVACVTGLIATAELTNSAQLYFHLREEWGAVCERRVFDLTENRDDSPLYPYSAGIFGAGANFAVSRPALKEIGPFDEALGAGTPSGGGEDLDIFMRVILGGHRLVYEPSAIVWHFHRTDLAELTRQMRAYGSGCTAALTAIVLRSPRARREIPPRVVRGIMRVFHLGSRVQDNPTLPTGLMAREVRGMLAGPWLYARGRRNLRRREA